MSVCTLAQLPALSLSAKISSSLSRTLSTRGSSACVYVCAYEGGGLHTFHPPSFSHPPLRSFQLVLLSSSSFLPYLFLSPLLSLSLVGIDRRFVLPSTLLSFSLVCTPSSPFLYPLIFRFHPTRPTRLSLVLLTRIDPFQDHHVQRGHLKPSDHVLLSPS